MTFQLCCISLYKFLWDPTKLATYVFQYFLRVLRIPIAIPRAPLQSLAMGTRHSWSITTGCVVNNSSDLEWHLLWLFCISSGRQHTLKTTFMLLVVHRPPIRRCRSSFDEVAETKTKRINYSSLQISKQTLALNNIFCEQYL